MDTGDYYKIIEGYKALVDTYLNTEMKSFIHPKLANVIYELGALIKHYEDKNYNLNK